MPVGLFTIRHQLWCYFHYKPWIKLLELNCFYFYQAETWPVNCRHGCKSSSKSNGLSEVSYFYFAVKGSERVPLTLDSLPELHDQQA